MAEAKPFVVIVHGPPAAGKTPFMLALKKRLRVQLISKDRIKELMFDVLGCKDQATSKKFGAFSFKLLFMQLEEVLEAGNSCIVETAFMPEYDNARFAQLQETHGCRLVQLYVTAESGVLYTRFSDRVISGDRHRGHCDSADGFRVQSGSAKWARLDIDGRTIVADTSTFSAADFEDERMNAFVETVVLAVAETAVEQRLG